MKKKRNDCFIAKSPEREIFTEIHRASIHLTENGQGKVLTRFWNVVAQRNGGEKIYKRTRRTQFRRFRCLARSRCAVVRVQSSCINSDYDPRRRKYRWFVLFTRALPFYRMDPDSTVQSVSNSGICWPGRLTWTLASIIWLEWDSSHVASIVSLPRECSFLVS